MAAQLQSTAPVCTRFIAGCHDAHLIQRACHCSARLISLLDGAQQLTASCSLQVQRLSPSVSTMSQPYELSAACTCWRGHLKAGEMRLRRLEKYAASHTEAPDAH